MHVEYSPSEYVVHVYDSHPDNYVASMRVQVIGDRGIVTNAHGRRLYEAIWPMIGELLDDMDVRTLEGYVTPPSARLLRMGARRHGAGFRITREGTLAGRRMAWVEISRSEDGKK